MTMLMQGKNFLQGKSYVGNEKTKFKLLFYKSNLSKRKSLNFISYDKYKIGHACVFKLPSLEIKGSTQLLLKSLKTFITVSCDKYLYLIRCDCHCVITFE